MWATVQGGVGGAGGQVSMSETRRQVLGAKPQHAAEKEQQRMMRSTARIKTRPLPKGLSHGVVGGFQQSVACTKVQFQ